MIKTGTTIDEATWASMNQLADTVVDMIESIHKTTGKKGGKKMEGVFKQFMK